MNFTTESRRLIPAAKWDQYHPWPSKAALRFIIFNAKKNGFDSVVRRIGRRVLIDEAAFFAWADRHGGSAMTADNQKTPEQLASASASSPPFRPRSRELPARTPPVPRNGRASS